MEFRCSSRKSQKRSWKREVMPTDRRPPPPFPLRLWPSLEAYTLHLWPASTGSAQQKNWPKSERVSGVKSLTHCWLRWRVSRRTELQSALDRLSAAGLLFRQGVPPHATYLFKHALVQDAAYGTLLREPRRALHARIAETLESQFADIAESQSRVCWRATAPRRGSL